MYKFRSFENFQAIFIIDLTGSLEFVRLIKLIDENHISWSVTSS